MLNGNVIRLHPQGDQRAVFGNPLNYHNWRARRWRKLLEATVADAEHPKLVPGSGSIHMLRHSYAMALIQSGENA